MSSQKRKSKRANDRPPKTIPINAKQYEIDWDKVKTIEDLKRILQTFGLVFTCPPANVDHIKHIVIPIENENK
jgi:hypothetical protein